MTDLAILAGQHGFKKTDQSIGSSVFYNCSIWETQHKGIYITDYDIIADESLKERQLAMIFSESKGCMLITHEFMSDKSAFDAFIKNYANGL